ncbi:MAG: molybdenum cofactor biosynthesis protein MoaE [Planctomycetota bacterium]|nr:MAG: molybdenum cofactor biosynthesis protein MoaE [Planctomycetota bacterium]
MACAVAHIMDGPLNPSVTHGHMDGGAGAVVTFLGVVRSEEHGARIDALEYTTYDPMAERILRALAADAIERFSVRSIAAEHSRGRVAVGECSFRLTIASVHRREALDAADWFIERMKRDAPIWKRPIPAPSPAVIDGAAI